MKLHPSVARVIAEAVSTIEINCYSPGPTHARGFYPAKNHPNLTVNFETCDTGDHPNFPDKKIILVQWSGDHPAGSKTAIYVSCIHFNQGGRFLAVFLDALAEAGGRMVGSFYFSWQGQIASLNSAAKAREVLFGRLKAAFGVPNLEEPTEKTHPELYRAAGLPVEEFKAQEEPVPEILKGKNELMPAYKVLSKAGADLSGAKSGAILNITQIPVDINHQNLIQKALDDMKDGGILDYDVTFDKGKMSQVTIMLEYIDSSKNGAIVEGMRTRDKVPVRFLGRMRTPWGEMVGKYACEGIDFTIDLHEEDGSVCVIKDNDLFVVGSYKKGKHAVNIVRETVKRLKQHGLNETVQMQFSQPINEETE